MVQRLEPLHRLVYLRVAGICPANHLEARDLVFQVQNDIGKD